MFFFFVCIAGPFICDNCNKKYKYKSSLKYHKQVECGKPPKYFCNVCSYRTHHKGNLQKHLYGLHKMSKERVNLLNL